MSHLVSYKWIRKTQVIPEYVVFYKNVGRLWKLSDLLRIKWGLVTGDYGGGRLLRVGDSSEIL